MKSKPPLQKLVTKAKALAMVSLPQMCACYCGLLLIGCFVASAVGQEFQDTRADFEAAIKSAVAKAAPVLVQLEVVSADNATARANTASGPRTAVVVSAEGLAVTASANIPGTFTSLAVRLADGNLVPASLIGHDESCRLALLEFNGDNLSIPTAVTKSEIKVGQTAIAIGKSFSHLSPTVSVGIVSARDRFWGKALQTDAKISPRNYGGALVDLEGNVLGILLPFGEESEVDSASGSDWYDSGIGFAIPLADVMVRLAKWRERRNLKAGKIGLSFRKSISIPADATVEGSLPGSPAAIMGIKTGDTITGVDNHSIISLNDFKFAMGTKYAGDQVKFTLENDKGVSRMLEIELVGELPKYMPAALGIIPSRKPGKELLIDHVIPGSPAESAGLQTSDVLVSLNGEPIGSWDDLRVALRGLLPDTNVVVGWRTATNEGRKRDVKLARQTASILDFPAQEVAGSMTISAEQMPEFANRYWLLQGGSSETPRPLLVWLLSPGVSTKEQIEKQWQELERHSAIVIAVESANKERWLPDDAEAVLRSLGEVTRKFRVDPNRVAIAGADSSGEVASLVLAANRDRFQGLVLVDSPLSDRIKEFVSAPDIPLSVLFASRSSFSAREELSLNQKSLAEWGIPVGTTDLPNDHAKVIESRVFRWLDCLDRL